MATLRLGIEHFRPVGAGGSTRFVKTVGPLRMTASRPVSTVGSFSGCAGATPSLYQRGTLMILPEAERLGAKVVLPKMPYGNGMVRPAERTGGTCLPSVRLPAAAEGEAVYPAADAYRSAYKREVWCWKHRRDPRTIAVKRSIRGKFYEGTLASSNATA